MVACSENHVKMYIAWEEIYIFNISRGGIYIYTGLHEVNIGYSRSSLRTFASSVQVFLSTCVSNFTYGQPIMQLSTAYISVATKLMNFFGGRFPCRNEMWITEHLH
jgi:hypothetical protein